MFYSGPPGEKARLISKEGGVCQSANLSIVSTKFDKAAACFKILQFLLFTQRFLGLTLTFKVTTVKATTVPLRTQFKQTPK